MIKFFPQFKMPKVEYPSNQWLHDFKVRNEAKSDHGYALDVKRSENATVGNISWWYDKVVTKVKWEDIDPKFIFNADETMIKQTGKRVVIVPKTAVKPQVQCDEKTEHVTIMTCVSANGDLMIPLFIFPLQTLPRHLDELMVAKKLDIVGEHEGWIDKQIFLKWVKSFIEFVKERRSSFKQENAKSVLFIDSHNSRESKEAMTLLEENNIQCITYPADCTHILQALDVGIFGPFKSYLKTLRERAENDEIEWTDENYHPTQQAVRRVKLTIAAVDALRQATTIRNIKRAFEKAGIYPLNKEAALANPRIGQSTEVTITLDTPKKRKNISIAGKIITSSEVIEELKKAEEDKEAQRYELNFIPIMFCKNSSFHYLERKRHKRFLMLPP
jgi:hypothetical protein